MAKTKDFRIQSAVVDTPGAGIASYYVNSSGILRFVHNNGTDYVASTFYPSSLAPLDVTNTGSFILRNTTIDMTGHVIGRTGSYTQPTLLGEPDLWVPVIMASGQLFSLPVYKRS